MRVLAALTLAFAGFLAAGSPASAVYTQRGIQYGARPKEIMDVYRPVRFGPEPAVVFVHSLGRDEAEWAQAASTTALYGYVGVTIDYDLQPWPSAPND